jgi:hypothetical protein
MKCGQDELQISAAITRESTMPRKRFDYLRTIYSRVVGHQTLDLVAIVSGRYCHEIDATARLIRRQWFDFDRQKPSSIRVQQRHASIQWIAGELSDQILNRHGQLPALR